MQQPSYLESYLRKMQHQPQPRTTLWQIQLIQNWLRAAGIESVLVMERVRDRNSVWLRLRLPSGEQLVEVARLQATLRKTMPTEQILATVEGLVHAAP